MRLLRLCFRIVLVVCEEIIAAIDEPHLPAAPEQFDGYRLGGEEEAVGDDD